MAKQGKTLPARRQRSVTEGSLLLRSAESLGRVIGTLQRQLDGASKRVAGSIEDLPFGNDGHRSRRDDAAATRRAISEDGAGRTDGAGTETARRGTKKTKTTKKKSAANGARTSKRAAKSASTGRSGSKKSAAAPAARKKTARKTGRS